MKKELSAARMENARAYDKGKAVADERAERNRPTNNRLNVLSRHCYKTINPSPEHAPGDQITKSEGAPVEIVNNTSAAL